MKTMVIQKECDINGYAPMIGEVVVVDDNYPEDVGKVVNRFEVKQEKKKKKDDDGKAK